MVTVPVDYSDLSRGLISLRAGRIPAAGGAARGVILYNPGGPGLSPIEGLESFAARLNPQVRYDYDIIGVDPRGVGGSVAIPCGSITTEPPSTSYSVFPTNAGQLAEQFDALDPWLRGTCDFTSPLLQHIGSIDAARDIESVRTLLEVDRINYYGVSYGAIIGAAYSRLFPMHTRTLTLDSPADPDAWFGAGQREPLWARFGSPEHSEQVLEDLFGTCEAAGDSCPWAQTIRSDYEHVVEALRTGELTIPGTGSLDASAFQSAVVSALYRFNLDGGEDYESLFRLIHALAQSVDGMTGAEAVPGGSVADSQARVGLGDQPQDATIAKALTTDAVMCADAHEPPRRGAWYLSAAAAEANSPGFGYYWISQDSICSDWPVEKDHAGAPGSGTIGVPFLVMSNAHDPVIGEWDSGRTRRLGPRGTAVVVADGWGHGVLRGSSCAVSQFSDYVISGALPSPSAGCANDVPLFAG